VRAHRAAHCRGVPLSSPPKGSTFAPRCRKYLQAAPPGDAGRAEGAALLAGCAHLTHGTRLLMAAQWRQVMPSLSTALTSNPREG
jgi:hypothetical protein